MLLILWRHLD